jgi:hypothetical protein
MISVSKRAVKRLMVSGLSALVALTIGFAGRAWADSGIIEINQAKVNAAGGFPYVISASGSYRLTSNLTVTGTSQDAIDINGALAVVSLDLNGFNIAGPGSGSGKGISGGATTSLLLSHGTVYHFGSNGIQVAGELTLKEVFSVFNGGAGIVATGGIAFATVTGSNNGGPGMVLSGGALNDVSADSNGSDGIQALTGPGLVTCEHCFAVLNGGNGINGGVNVILLIKDSGFAGNTMNGIVAGDGSVIESTSSGGNHGYGILANAAILKSDQAIGNNAGNASGGILGVDAALNVSSVGNDSGCWNNWAGGNGSSPSVAQISGCAPAGENICPGGTACP